MAGLLFLSCALFFQKVELYILDLSQPREVVKFAEEFVSSGKPLDVLVSEKVSKQVHDVKCVVSLQVNNAGTMNAKREVDADGIESNFCVNTLGMIMH